MEVQITFPVNGHSWSCSVTAATPIIIDRKVRLLVGDHGKEENTGGDKLYICMIY